MGAGEPEIVAALREPSAYPHAVEAVEVVETHISWVFLTGEYAYKVKKPVKLAFLDFSTLAHRKRYCEDELALNRRLAPDLYLEVVPIGGHGRTARVGTAPAREYAVKMRQFPSTARLDRALAAGTVEEAQILAFAERLAAFHDALPPLRDVEAAAAARAVSAAARTNVRELASQPVSQKGAAPGAAADDARARPGGAAVAELAAWIAREAARLEPMFAARYADGAHRDCHGDMHLENLLVLGGEIAAFDALEFDAALRAVDREHELAFVAMDLLAHGREDLAYPFVTRYLETSGDYDGLAVLRFYLVDRALVRAKVRALQAPHTHGKPAGTATANVPDGAAYLALATRLTRPRRPLLVLAHGLSGSGKTTITNALLARFPSVRVRSDLERKRLLGVAHRAATASAVGGGAYAQDVSRRTYGRLREVAGLGLAGGFDVIVDAAFLETSRRAAFLELARELGAGVAILDCTASAHELRRRIAARSAAGRDESEATVEVLDWQLARREPLTSAELAHTIGVATEREIDLAALARRLDDRRGQASA